MKRIFRRVSRRRWFADDIAAAMELLEDDDDDGDDTDNCCPLCGIEIAPGERHKCPDED